LSRAINCDDGDRAAKIIRDAFSASKATTWSITLVRDTDNQSLPPSEHERECRWYE
jgi:hypothetical protein